MSAKRVASNGRRTVEPIDLFPGGERLICPDPEGRDRYRKLSDFLTPRFRDNYQSRQPGKLTIEMRGLVWLVKLTLPTEKAQAEVECDSLLEVFERLEKLLANNTIKWRDLREFGKKGLTVEDAMP